jgi:hypothetical protein
MLKAAQNARVEKTLPRILERYAEHEARCGEALARGVRLKVAFLVCDASMFSGESVFALMREDPRFECVVAVAPRVTRGEEFLRATLKKTMDTLRARYGEAVQALYDPDARKARPLDADIVFSTVVYEDQTLPEYTTERLSLRSLVCVLYYGYGGLFISNERKTPYLPNIIFAWRYFVSNEDTKRMNMERNPLFGGRIVASGYCKMDRLEALKGGIGGRRRKILICPHHTLEKVPGELALATFPRNADLFLRLPDMFPEIDFVFRPHPLLFPRLATAKWWGPERTAAYERAMEAHSNVEFQRGGDYFESFAQSHAMIHDCGSFLAEYFYTGRPQCFLLADDETARMQFLPFSKRLLGHVTTAMDEKTVVDFIRRVVVDGDDPGKAARDEFAAKEVCVNHPHAARAVVDAVCERLPFVPESPFCAASAGEAGQ